ncbi:MAG: molybdenum cofactor guanylyltransferase [Gallionella sp.]|nr:molybdenum cofactor guanylyltransferase [Gallionella sp.]
MIEDCTAIILAGGESKRMGRDKANLLLDGQTLLQHVIATMQQVFPRIIISVREPRPEIALPQVCDAPDVHGPLAGVIAALAQIQTPWAFIVACDMPFVRPALIETLGEYRAGHQAVVPVVQGHAQSLAAFYASSVPDVIRAHLARGGKNSLRATFEHLRIRYVDETELLQADPALRSFFDVDTPQDLSLAMRARAPLKSS